MTWTVEIDIAPQGQPRGMTARVTEVRIHNGAAIGTYPSSNNPDGVSDKKYSESLARKFLGTGRMMVRTVRADKVDVRHFRPAAVPEGWTDLALDGGGSATAVCTELSPRPFPYVGAPCRVADLAGTVTAVYDDGSCDVSLSRVRARGPDREVDG